MDENELWAQAEHDERHTKFRELKQARARVAELEEEAKKQKDYSVMVDLNLAVNKKLQARVAELERVIAAKDEKFHELLDERFMTLNDRLRICNEALNLKAEP